MKPPPFALINQLIKDKKSQELQALLRSLSATEIADLIRKRGIPERAFVFNLLSPEQAVETFSHLSVKAQKRLLRALPSTQIKNILTEMPPDNRTALLEKLPPNLVDEYIKLLPKEERVITLKLLGYPQNSIGRLMTTDYIAIQRDWTIEQVFDYIREHGHDSETIDVIYVVDDHDILIDEIRLKELLFHPKNTKISEICDQKFIALTPYEKADDAIKVFREHNRVALPVVNSEGLMLGIVTIDDILRLASKRGTTEVQKIGGSEALNEPDARNAPF